MVRRSTLSARGSTLSARERQRQRLAELRTLCQATANGELEGAARENNVEFSTNNTISGSYGVISAYGIPGLHIYYFRVEAERGRVEEHRSVLAEAGFIQNMSSEIPWILIWKRGETAKTKAAIALISPPQFVWPVRPEIFW